MKRSVRRWREGEGGEFGAEKVEIAQESVGVFEFCENFEFEMNLRGNRD